MDSLREEHIIAVTKLLWERRRKQLQLDEVDGAFYWWCCRANDVPNPFAARSDDWTREELTALHAEAPDWFRWTEEGHLPRIRAPWIRLGFHGSVLMGIPSREWRGCDVADDIRAWVRRVEDNPASQEFFTPEKYESIDGVCLQIRAWFKRAHSFAFTPHPSLVPDRFEDRLPRPLLGFPVVLVDLPLPLPPFSVIEAFYDGVVIGEKQWHLQLVGESNQQTVEVAIRTWAIALLARSGMNVNKAIDLVADHTRNDSISQERFNQARRHLRARVPEAAPYLFVSPRLGTKE